uniref:Uncharacterized protein n=1 Tax=Bicosoecida sp. CB-2014 TaxID=1486930 RepID=A0A7S1G6G7_9STRA|mmetsp:Transcript_17206/g.60466  ORF Transcript_17206/g.60466 Transcript_17206/m.60466 type:complete len:126 (+) Transcript_17206:107-484(+)
MAPSVRAAAAVTAAAALALAVLLAPTVTAAAPVEAAAGPGGNCTHMADYHACDSACTSKYGSNEQVRGPCDSGCDIRCNDDDDDTPHPVYCIDADKCKHRCISEYRHRGATAQAACQAGCDFRCH